jgi:hypothetical protein
MKEEHLTDWNIPAELKIIMLLGYDDIIQMEYIYIIQMIKYDVIEKHRDIITMLEIGYDMI